MFAMDFTSRGRAWIEKIGEKLESLCSEVDTRSQELGFVENQLQIAGANLKQFCSELIQEIFPASLSDAEEETSNLSSEQNREEQLFASELSNISVQEDNKDELSHSNSSSLELAMETAEGVNVDSSVQPQADKAMHMSVKGNLEKALSFTGESSPVVVSTEETLKMTSLSCEGDKGIEGHAKASNAALPAVSNGASVDHHVNEPAIDSVPEVEFDGNCVLVDKDDLSSGSEFHGAHISYKKNMPRLKVKPGKQRNKDAKCEDVNVELEQSNAQCKTKPSPIENLELSQGGFCESDWEII